MEQSEDTTRPRKFYTTVGLYWDQIERLQTLAERRDRSMAALVREAIDLYLGPEKKR